MNAKRTFVAIALMAVVFGSFVFQQPSVKAAGVWTSIAQIVTLDNSMCQEKWGKITATRNVTITDQGGGFYLVTFVDDGTLVTLGSHSPGGDCATTFVGSGVIAHWTGGQSVVVQGVLKNPVPTNVTVDYTNDSRPNKYFLAFFDSVVGANYQTWGWVYSTCGNGTWRDNDSTENAWNSQGPNSLMGDIIGAPAACQLPPPDLGQPQSCNANSVVLAPFVGNRVRVYLVQGSGLQELQYERLNFVEHGLVDGHPSGKVSFVFYNQGSSWKEFEGSTLLVRVEGYVDAWYWFPQGAAGKPNTLFCGWKTAPGKGFPAK